MANSKIPYKRYTERGTDATRTLITASPSSGHYMQIRAISTLGDFILYANNSGIKLYDNTNSQVIHSIDWMS